MQMKEQFIAFIHALQDEICQALEAIDGKAKFREDLWERTDGGGGKTRIIANGNVFEKGGVNTSIVHGPLPEALRGITTDFKSTFFACGISLVIHPKNPHAPTVHANYRYFELYDRHGHRKDAWFGGGSDLTPYYLYEEDAILFHQGLKDACEPIEKGLYHEFKLACDAYFYNSHRRECRGIGGVFYDHIRSSKLPEDKCLELAKNNGQAFLDTYTEIINRRKDTPFTEKERYFQEIRRGRYVEFNLIHDRGTHFGLKSNGRVESILMSLPNLVRWDYDYKVEKGSREAELIEVLRKPKNWLKK